MMMCFSIVFPNTNLSLFLSFVFRFFCFSNNQKTNREHWLIDWSINLMTIFVTIDDDDDYRLFLPLSNNHDDDDSNNHLFCFNLIFWSIVCLCVWRFPFLFMSVLVFGFYFYLKLSTKKKKTIFRHFLKKRDLK